MVVVVLVVVGVVVVVLLLLLAGFEAALAGQLAAGASYSETITWPKVKRLLSVASNWIIIIQLRTAGGTPDDDQPGIRFGGEQFAGKMPVAWHVSKPRGAVGQLLYNWRKESMAILTGLSVLGGIGPVFFLVNAPLQSMSLAVSLAMAALAGVLVSIAGPNLRAIMLNVNVPETRGVALALQSVTDDLGRGLGPVIVAGFISRLGRQGAFNVAIAGWVPCGVLLVSLVFTIRRDEAAMQQQLAAKAESALRHVEVVGTPDSSYGTGTAGYHADPARLAAGSSSRHWSGGTSSSGGGSGGVADGQQYGSSSCARHRGGRHEGIRIRGSNGGSSGGGTTVEIMGRGVALGEACETAGGWCSEPALGSSYAGECNRGQSIESWHYCFGGGAAGVIDAGEVQLVPGSSAAAGVAVPLAAHLCCHKSSSSSRRKSSGDGCEVSAVVARGWCVGVGVHTPFE
eukprot:gene10190-10350_t